MPKEHFFGKINLSDTDPLRTDLLEIYSLDGKSYILAVFGNYPPTLLTPAVYRPVISSCHCYVQAQVHNSSQNCRLISLILV